MPIRCPDIPLGDEPCNATHEEVGRDHLFQGPKDLPHIDPPHPLFERPYQEGEIDHGRYGRGKRQPPCFSGPIRMRERIILTATAMAAALAGVFVSCRA